MLQHPARDTCEAREKCDGIMLHRMTRDAREAREKCDGLAGSNTLYLYYYQLFVLLPACFLASSRRLIFGGPVITLGLTI